MNRGQRNHRNALELKTSDGEGSVTWGIVLMEHPSVSNVCSQAFQGRLYKKKTWLPVFPGGTNPVWTIPIL